MRKDTSTKEKLQFASEVFRAFGNPVRLRILDALKGDKIRVTELAEMLDYPQPIISQQLRILKNAGIVQKVRDGNNYYYTLTDVNYTFVIQCVKKCLGIAGSI